MTHFNKIISSIFAAVIFLGMTLSAIHIHIDDFSDVETDTMIVKEEFHCVICGSVVQTDPNTQEFIIKISHPEEHFNPEEIKYIPARTISFKDGRAPPSLLA